MSWTEGTALADLDGGIRFRPVVAPDAAATVVVQTLRQQVLDVTKTWTVARLKADRVRDEERERMTGYVVRDIDRYLDTGELEALHGALSNLAYAMEYPESGHMSMCMAAVWADLYTTLRAQERVAA